MNLEGLDWKNAPQGDPDHINQIEAMTPREIKARLTDHGLFAGIGEKYYRRAKRVIFGGQWIDCTIYDGHIELILKHLRGEE